MPGKKKNHWVKATAFQKRERHRKNTRLEPTRNTDPLALLRAKVVERVLPPRLDLRDSKGQPISLPEVSILKER